MNRKLLTVLAAAALVAALGYHLAAPSRGTDPPHGLLVIDRGPPPTTTNTDPVQVFQQAFWKHPGADDQILHAERREWNDKDGISRWQWFIAVKPGAELTKHLKADNAFSLTPSNERPRIKDAPSWFAIAPEGIEVLQAPRGHMRLIFSSTDRTLYATDSGDGFKPGASEPGKPFPQTASSGRLPTTPPPRP